MARIPKPRATGSADAGRPPAQEADAEASRRIDEKLRLLGDWRAATLAELRRLIHEADPEVVEEVKWVKPGNPLGVPVWSHAGVICTGETYAAKVKLTFARGAALADPEGLFNASLEGNARRAIDLSEGDALDADAFRALFEEAVAENVRVQEARADRARGARRG